jgi:WbqC-like protein family
MIYSVHQPHYIPYPGYLAKVALSDTFVFLEQVQYVKREWMNRNKIKSPEGTNWLTVPVKGEYKSRIDEMDVDNSVPWAAKHISTLKRFYTQAKHMDEVDGFESVINGDYKKLSDLTVATTSFFLDIFSIRTPRKTQSDFDNLPLDPNLRIIEIGKRLGADTYLAGSGGKNYMDTNLFNENGIEVIFIDNMEVTYHQQYGDFIPNLGSIDLLLNEGRDGFDRHLKPLLQKI